MNEFCNYIFDGLRESRIDIRSIERNLSHQRIINRNIIMATFMVTGCVALLHVQSKITSNKIDSLTKEIEVLKQQKGE